MVLIIILVARVFFDLLIYNHFYNYSLLLVMPLLEIYNRIQYNIISAYLQVNTTRYNP